MKSRERILCALNHEEADRVPIDFGAFRSSGIHIGTYAKLRVHLGLEPGKPRLYDLMQQLAEPDNDILDRFHADVVQVHNLRPSFTVPIDAWKESTLPDGTPIMVPEDLNPVKTEDGCFEIRENGTPVARMTPGGLYFDLVHHPLEKAETEADLDSFFPQPEVTDEEIDFIVQQAQEHRKTDRAVLYCFGGNIIEGGQGLMGLMSYLMNVAANPDLIAALGERLTDMYIRNLKRLLPALGDTIDVISCGDDLGVQRGLQISKEDYQKLIKPYHRKVYGYIRENTGARLFLHSCGAIEPLIPDLIEAGVQILNPVQFSAKGMELSKLKERYGTDLVFWGGGCDTQKTLPYGTPDEVRREAAENISIMKPGGGFVFTQVHNILQNVPAENVAALYDTAYETGTYTG